MDIQETLNQIEQELDDSNITKQRRRYLESYKADLEKYSMSHPNIKETPNSFELFCELNPQAPESLKYDI